MDEETKMKTSSNVKKMYNKIEKVLDQSINSFGNIFSPKIVRCDSNEPFIIVNHKPE